MMTPKEICVVHHLGLVPYSEAWDLQRKLGDEVANGNRPPTLLLLEHPHTYTFGRRGNPENLLWTSEECQQRGIEVLWVDRGGDITYHGPGQLVGYPILPLATGFTHKGSDQDLHIPKADYVGYVRRLEKTIIKTLELFGLISSQIEGLTGVWVLPDVVSRYPDCPPEAHLLPSKIAAIGVKVTSKGITQHGFALNVNPNMEYWGGIIGCGLKEHPVARIVDLLQDPPSLKEISTRLSDSFGKVFNYQMVRGTL